MASVRAMKERTVAFYEVVAAGSGAQQRMDQLAWEEMLSALAKTKDVNERTFEADSVFVGSVATVQRGVRAFLERTGADELIVSGHVHDHAARLRSFALAAQVRDTL